MGQLSVDYFLLVFVAASGVLQMAASQSGLKGMMFFSRPSHSLITGLVMIVGAFLWFFLSAPRNVPDTQGGLDGNTQTGLFAAGAGAALVFTLLTMSTKDQYPTQWLTQRNTVWSISRSVSIGPSVYLPARGRS